MKKSAASESIRHTDHDIVALILEDHVPLKKLIHIMKDSEATISARKAAFQQFAPLLVRHAKPEEESLYVFMKHDKELREEGLEGDVEHGLADQLIEEAKRTDDKELFAARVKVLAELVEHHIEEEEEEMLPDFKKNTDIQERISLGEKYLKLRSAVREDLKEESTPRRKKSETDQPRAH